MGGHTRDHGGVGSWTSLGPEDTAPGRSLNAEGEEGGGGGLPSSRPTPTRRLNSHSPSTWG